MVVVCATSLRHVCGARVLGDMSTMPRKAWISIEKGEVEGLFCEKENLFLSALLGGQQGSKIEIPKNTFKILS